MVNSVAWLTVLVGTLLSVGYLYYGEWLGEDLFNNLLRINGTAFTNNNHLRVIFKDYLDNE